MKKLSTILIAFFALGACMLNPLTPPPPALDMNNPADKAKVDELVNKIKDKMPNLGSTPVVIESDGTLKLPSKEIPAEFKDMLPSDAEGNIVLDLHSIETVDGADRIVYKSGDSYIAVVVTYDGTGKPTLSVKNSPTIDFGTIDWDSPDNIFVAKP